MLARNVKSKDADSSSVAAAAGSAEYVRTFDPHRAYALANSSGAGISAPLRSDANVDILQAFPRKESGGADSRGGRWVDAIAYTFLLPPLTT